MSEKRSTLPQGWEWKKLGDICDFQNGFAFKSNLFKNQGSIIVRISNIQNSVVELKDVAYFDKNDYKNLDAYRVIKGDILIAMSGATTGKIGIYQNDEIAFLNQRVGKFIIVSELLKQYLFYFLTTQIEENLKKSFGAAQPNLSTEQIKNIDIPLPPLEEQRRIVGKLDGLFGKIDKSIALLDESIASASSLMPSALNEVFEELGEKWEKKKFEDIFINIRYGHTAKANESGSSVFLRITDINENGYINEDGLKFTDVSKNDYMKYEILQDDILVARSGATAGKICIWNLDYKAIFASYLIKFTPIATLVNPRFTFYFCHSPLYWEQLNVIKIGGAQPNVNATNLKEILLPLPPLDIQTQTVAYLDALQLKAQALKKAQEKKKEELLALKASLLESAFKGAL